MNPSPSSNRQSSDRVGHEDRDRCLSLLSEGYARGYLDEETFESRSGRALAAVSWDELTTVTADLSTTNAVAKRTWSPELGQRVVKVALPVAAIVVLTVVTSLLADLYANGNAYVWLGSLAFGLLNMWVGSKVFNRPQ